VSELIGTVLLVGLVITAMAIVTVVVLSNPPPEQVPHVNALAGNMTDSVLVYHNGGDELKEEMTVVLLNDNSVPVDHSNIFLKHEDGSIESRPWSETKTPWSVGKPRYQDVNNSGGHHRHLQGALVTEYHSPDFFYSFYI